MGLVNFLADKFGAGIVIDTLKETYPPAIVLIDALGTYSLPVALDYWADSHARYVLTQPPGVSLPWDKNRHRFLTEKPCLPVLLDLLKDLGMAELAGIDVSEFIAALIEYKGRS